ncbi:MAG: hypothetical protein U0T77_04075 [Chitinophagales bacterium]
MSCIFLDENNINIDYRNKLLFNEIYSNGNVIELCKNEPVMNGAWCMDFIGIDDFGKKVYRIYANTIEPNYAQFTHELLHIWLYDRGNKNTNELEILLENVKHSLINIVFESDYESKGLKNDHFVVFENLISHFKMIDKFIELDFNRNEFLYSYKNDYDCILNELQIIEENSSIRPNYYYILLYLRIRSLEFIHSEYSLSEITQLLHRLKNLINQKVKNLIKFCDAFFEKWIDSLGADNYELYQFMLDNYKMYIVADKSNVNKPNLDAFIGLSKPSDDFEINI